MSGRAWGIDFQTVPLSEDGVTPLEEWLRTLPGVREVDLAGPPGLPQQGRILGDPALSLDQRAHLRRQLRAHGQILPGTVVDAAAV